MTDDVPMPSLQHVRLQFKPSYSRHEVSKYFYRRFNVVKKTQRKALQCHNPDMHYANSNPKKFRTVIVNEFSPDDTLIASVDDECHVKFGDPKKPLALAQKAKPQWVSRIYVNTRVQTPFRIKKLLSRVSIFSSCVPHS